MKAKAHGGSGVARGKLSAAVRGLVARQRLEVLAEFRKKPPYLGKDELGIAYLGKYGALRMDVVLITPRHLLKVPAALSNWFEGRCRATYEECLKGT